MCVSTLLERAESAFADKGLKLTTLRVRVLKEIASSHDAVGAYDIVDRLGRQSSSKLAPISVYRAIEALLQAGVVHRLESRNAYFACHAPHATRDLHIALVCEVCAHVEEVPASRVHAQIEAAGRAKGFSLRTSVAEGIGRCADCSAAKAD